MNAEYSDHQITKFQRGGRSAPNHQIDLPIGIFDSGIGGLTILHLALKELPHESFIYYADTEHVPYGTKPKKDVNSYVLKAASFLNDAGIKALVVACNTATSIAVKQLRELYSFPVLGMEPAVKPAVEKTSGKRVLVLATPLTLQEQKFKDLVDRVDNANIVDMIATPELVDLSERFIFDEASVIQVLKSKLSHIDTSLYGTVVLGCTHFPFFRKLIAKMFPSFTNIIDGNEGTVRHLKNILEKNNLLSPKAENRTVTYYNSGAMAERKRFEKYLSMLDRDH